MLSSIWVATITGLAHLRALSMMRFCTEGTCSGGSSTPRSPRATITPSHASTISSSRSIADGFSIFASKAVLPAPPAIEPSSITLSAAGCTDGRTLTVATSVPGTSGAAIGWSPTTDTVGGTPEELGLAHTTLMTLSVTGCARPGSSSARSTV